MLAALRAPFLGLIALAFAALGAGHRVTAADLRADLISAYALTAADLCDAGGDGPQTPGRDCPVCHVAPGLVVPVLAAVVRDAGLARRLHFATAAPIAISPRPPLTAHQPRAPPLT